MDRLIKLGAAWLIASAVLGQTNSPSVDPATTEVSATFDPRGPFDNDDVVKDPFGPLPADYEEEPGDEDFDDRGGPPNDTCSSAVIIPGNVVTYNPATYSTVGASVQLCETNENCEVGAAGTSNSVWYRYTPAKDGFIVADTHGSNYNTVLSIWNGCPGGVPPNCSARTQLACNDDYLFGTTSEVGLLVNAGTNYYIRVSDYNSAAGGGTLNFNLRYFPPNDVCASAAVVSGIAYSDVLSTQNAADELCEEDESCEVSDVGVSNAVWYKYTPPCNGSISLNTNGSTYDTVMSIWDGCGEWVSVDWPCIQAAELACDDDSGTGTASQILNFAVTEGTDYIIKVADYNTTQGGGTLNFNLLFSGAGAPTAAITAPSAFGCVCGGNVTVTGSASAGSDLLLGWKLDFQAGAGGAWTTINSGTSPVSNATLGTWNTAALASGYYILRLSVSNGCGVANSAVQVVFVDQAFQTLELRAPQNGNIVGGSVCIDGTAWDTCFSRYAVEYRVLPSGTFAPVDPANPTYGSPVINDGLANWNTTGLADGSYELRVAAFDACNHSDSVMRTITIDNTPPLVEIETPQACSTVSGEVEVIGTARDTNFAGWTLQYTGGTQHGWTTIASGNTQVSGGVLANWDTSRLSACGYTLRLLAADRSIVNCDDPHSSEYLVTVQVGGGGNPCPTDINGDGVTNLTDLATLLIFFGTSCP
jgi:hypothetical protein